MSVSIYALEVGQGDSHVMLAGREAVVIDAGPRTSPALDFLQRYVHRVKALILTHNDRDHSTGALRILEHFGTDRRIDIFWSLQDRSPEKATTRVIARAMELSDKGLLRIERLEINGPPREVTRFDEGYVLTLLHPTYAANLKAIGQASIPAKGPNRTSAVLRLCNPDGNGTGLWSGDLPQEAWATLLEQTDCSAKWFVVPHHGSGKNWSSASISDVLSAVKPQWMVVSVGTNNPHGHPANEWIEKARTNGTQVVCTQITARCHSDIGQLGEGVLARDASLHPRPSTGVACGGTLVYRLSDETVLRLDLHQEQIANLASPMCRSRSVPQLGHQALDAVAESR